MQFFKEHCEAAGRRKLRPLCLFVGMALFVMLMFSGSAVFALTPVYKISFVKLSEIFWHSCGQTAMFFLTTYCLGRLVIRGWEVNYTRKIAQSVLFFMPLFFALYHPPFEIAPVGLTSFMIINSSPDILVLSKSDIGNPGKELPDLWEQGHISSALVTMFATGAIVFLWTIAFSPFVTKRIKFFATAFAAIDRPEDRPRTLLWLRTEIIAAYLAILGFLFFLETFNENIKNALFVVIFVSSIGDAISGIIGYRYGKRHYKVRALFSKQDYTRTLEGSFCLFLSAVAAIAFIFFPAGAAEWPRFLTLLVVAPAAMTLAEAKSPHSWDNPLIVLSGLLSISLVLFLFP